MNTALGLKKPRDLKNATKILDRYYSKNTPTNKTKFFGHIFDLFIHVNVNFSLFWRVVL